MVKGKKLTAILLAVIAVVGLTALSAQAADYDLTSTGATATINGAIYTQIDPQSTGTGVLDPFLRIQANGTEQGYNSDAAPMDDKAGTWTHDLLLSTLGTVDVGGAFYYRFVLDINESSGGGNSILSLDSVKIYTSTTPNQSTTSLGSLVGTLRYDLDLGGDNTVLLDYALNEGSGSGDMSLLVPMTAFAGVPANEEWLILYSHFGGKGGNWDSSDGFEEWAGYLGPAIPEPSTAVTVGLGILSLAGLLRRRRS